MDRAGVKRRLFAEAGGDLLRPAWNPVRLNRQGTLELRGMDSNYPEVILTALAMILGAADRVRRDGLEVVPDDAVLTFESTADALRVPGFGSLGGELLYAAVTGGVSDETVATYLDSVLDFSGVEEERLARFSRQRRSTGVYPTTEADILEEQGSDAGPLSEDRGLRIALKACDALEAEVSALIGSPAP